MCVIQTVLDELQDMNVMVFHNPKYNELFNTTPMELVGSSTSIHGGIYKHILPVGKLLIVGIVNCKIVFVFEEIHGSINGFYDMSYFKDMLGVTLSHKEMIGPSKDTIHYVISTITDVCGMSKYYHKVA